MKIKNKDVIQSYLLTTARYDFNVFEKRILYRLVEACQAQIKGQKLNYKFHIQSDIFKKTRSVTISLNSFLKSSEDKNHYQVKKVTNLALVTRYNCRIPHLRFEVVKIRYLLVLPLLMR